MAIEKFPFDMPIAVRSPMAHVHEGRLYVFGGCRGYRDHIDTVQVFDIKAQQWEVSDLRLRKARSCFMLSSVGA